MDLSPLSDDQDERDLLDAGFTPAQAVFAATLLLHALIATPKHEPPPPAAGPWIATLLPPEWICRLLANHITSPTEGVNLYERAMRTPGMTLRLDIRADSLGANCRDLIIDEDAFRHRIDLLARA